MTWEVSFRKPDVFRLGLVAVALRDAIAGARLVDPGNVPPGAALGLLDAGDWSNRGLEPDAAIKEGRFEDFRDAIEAPLRQLEPDVASLPTPADGRQLPRGAAALRTLAVVLFPSEDAKLCERGAAGLPARASSTLRDAAAVLGNHSLGMMRAYALLVRCEDRCRKEWPQTRPGAHVRQDAPIHGKRATFAPFPDADTLVRKYREERTFQFEGREFPSARLWDRVEGITEDQLIVEKIDAEWTSSELARRGRYVAALERSNGKHVFNGLNARLRSWSESPGGSVRLEFQPVRYHLHLATSAYADTPDPDGKTPRETYEPGPRFTDLATSQVAGELGMNGLVETRDGFVLGVRRGDKGIGTPNALGPSVSGGLRYGSVWEKGGGPFRAIREELERELGIAPVEVSDLRMVSLTRGMLYAGHPRVQFLIKTTLMMDEIRQNVAEGTEEGYEIDRKAGKAVQPFETSDLAGIVSQLKRKEVSAPLANLLAYHVLRARGTTGPAP